MATEGKPKSKRGFASMSPEKRAEIASKGGKSVPKEKRSFAVNKALAMEAGRKGGQSTPRQKRAFGADRGLASDPGRNSKNKGGA